MEKIENLKALFYPGDVHRARFISQDKGLITMKLECGIMGFIPQTIVNLPLVSPQWEKMMVDVMVCGYNIGALNSLLVLFPFLNSANFLTENLCVYEGKIELITRRGSLIRIENEEYVFDTYQDYFRKMKQGDKVHVFMMGTTLEKRHVFTIMEACINVVNVDFYPKQHLEKISEKYGFRTVLFLEKTAMEDVVSYCHEASNTTLHNIKAQKNYCIYDTVDNRVLTEWD